MDILIPDYIKIVETQILSLGSEKDLTDIFPYIFKKCDPKIKEFKFYPYYSKVIKWMSNDQGTGLAIYRENGDNTVNNGLGKSHTINKVYPTLLSHVYGDSLPKPIFLNGAYFGQNTIVELDKILGYEGRQIIIFDEMGREPSTINYYGTIIKPMERILEHVEKTKSKFICATNMSPNSANTHYDSSHFSDRIRSLCCTIECSDVSSRQSAKSLFKW